jgi:hypothetical protein
MENLEHIIQEMIGKETKLPTEKVAPLKGTDKKQLCINAVHSNTPWARLYNDKEEKESSFQWKTSQIRKNYLVSLDVPVNLDEMYGKTVAWNQDKATLSETDEQIEIRQLLALGDTDYENMSVDILQAHLDQLKRVLHRMSQQINHATEQRDKYTKEIDTHNKTVASLVFIAQQQRSRR